MDKDYGKEGADVVVLASEQRDSTTDAAKTISYPHNEIHGGSRFYVLYSVTDLGVMATPNDMITLDFTTPNTTKWGHWTFSARGISGWRVRLIEAPTGGAASPTGQIVILNRNRNSTKTSTFTDGSTANQVNYDSTLATGGTVLWDEYLAGNTTNKNSLSSSSISERDELMLKQNTKYQLSLFGTDNFPATLFMDHYEHTNR